MFNAIICHNIFPDEKEQLADTKNGFLSIYSENKKRRRKKK
jgi:hypothetical protein